MLSAQLLNIWLRFNLWRLFLGAHAPQTPLSNLARVAYIVKIRMASFRSRPCDIAIIKLPSSVWTELCPGVVAQQVHKIKAILILLRTRGTPVKYF